MRARQIKVFSFLLVLGGCFADAPLEPKAGSSSGPAAGVPSWHAAGGVSPAGWVPLAMTASSDWEIGGVADMTGDGKADVVWQNRSTRETGTWVMDRMALAGWVSIAPVASGDWRIGGVAHMGGDGRADIMWHNRTSLRSGVWIMHGTTYAGWVPTVDFESGDWEIGGVADMTGDGKADVIWQNRVTLQTGVWVMDGTTYVRWVPIAPVESRDWEIGGVADMTRDGNADIVWQNRTTRQTGVWVMDRTRLTGWIEMRKAMSSDWQIGGVADLDGDGHPDIVWQDRPARQTGVWIMNGTTVTGYEPVASVVVTPENSNLTVGATVQLTATVRDAAGNPLTGREVVWSSSNSAVARVSSSGVVSAVGSGTAMIVATSEEMSGAAHIAVPATTIIDTRPGAEASHRTTFGGEYSGGTLSTINHYGQTFTVGSRRRLDSFAFLVRAYGDSPGNIEPMRYRAVIAEWDGPTRRTIGLVWQSEMRTEAGNSDYQEERFNPGIVLEEGRTYIAYLLMESASINPGATGKVFQNYQGVLVGNYKEGEMLQWSGNMPANLAASTNWAPPLDGREWDLGFLAAFSMP